MLVLVPSPVFIMSKALFWQMPSELADPETHAKEILTNAVSNYVASR